MAKFMVDMLSDSTCDTVAGRNASLLAPTTVNCEPDGV
jgi:hypothetical protein